MTDTENKALYIDDYEQKPDDDFHNIILPREDWTEEEEAEFQRILAEEDRKRRETIAQWRKKIIQKLKSGGKQ